MQHADEVVAGGAALALDVAGVHGAAVGREGALLQPLQPHQGQPEEAVPAGGGGG